MKATRITPEVNAGSMADIAFLLLIFFLVTASIENDAGLSRMLPPDTLDHSVVDIKKRNLLEISINSQNSLMVRENELPLDALREQVVEFLDNGGIEMGEEGFCAYCMGGKTESLSQHPHKAIISLNAHRNSDYWYYVAVQNEIIGAYNQLRNRESQRLFGIDYQIMVSNYNSLETSEVEKETLKERIVEIRSYYPLKLVEPNIIQSKNLEYDAKSQEKSI